MKANEVNFLTLLDGTKQFVAADLSTSIQLEKQIVRIYGTT